MRALFLTLIFLLTSLNVIHAFSWDCASNGFILACYIEYSAGFFQDYCQCYLKGFEHTIPSYFTKKFECTVPDKVPKCYHNNPYSPEIDCRCANFIE